MFKAIRLKKIIIWVVLFLVLINAKNITKIFFPVNYSEIVYKYAKEYEVNPSLIFSIIKAESDFKPDAVSNKKARGLMQITEPTSKWISEKLEKPELCRDFLVPENNILMGTYYIKYLLDMYDGNERLALCAYNAGFNLVNRWLKDENYSPDGKSLTIIPYRETELYVTKVINNKKFYDILY